MEAWLDFARGPFFRFALALFVLGLIRHAIVTWLGVRNALSKADDKKLPGAAIRKATVRWVFPFRAFNEKRSFSVASVAFHVGVILAPLFLATHVLLVERATGIAWPTLPNLIADILTIAAIVGIVFMFASRVSTPDGRALTRGQDLWVLILVGLPFLSGFLAMHPTVNPLPYPFTMLVHVLSANVALAIVPFTKLVHIALMPATQYVSEVGWHFPADAGEKVAKALGKENQPI